MTDVHSSYRAGSLYIGSFLTNTSFLFFSCGQGHYHMPETRGICLSEEHTISKVRTHLSLSHFHRQGNICSLRFSYSIKHGYTYFRSRAVQEKEEIKLLIC